MSAHPPTPKAVKAVPSRIVLVGGTHGNELTGIHLLKYWHRHPSEIKREGLTVETVLANPEATRLVRRYVDADLNRCFRLSDLANPALQTYEQQRARELSLQLGPAGPESPTELLIDLHGTTSRMGLSLIISQQEAFEDPVFVGLLRHLAVVDPAVRVMYMPNPPDDNPYLPSLAQREITLEVGPVPHGTLQADLFLRTRALVARALDYLAALHSPTPLPLANAPLTYYQVLRNVDYPRDAQGELSAMIHPLVQGRDYEALKPGDPLFLSFSGEVIFYQGDEVVYPVFINEQAYYEKSVALTLTRRQELVF